MFFVYLSFFCNTFLFLTIAIYMYADVGAERPADLSHIARRAQPTADPQVEGGAGDELLQNLEALTRGIPDYARLVDVPFPYQRHTVGVLTRIHRLLRCLVRAVTCYHENHHE